MGGNDDAKSIFLSKEVLQLVEDEATSFLRLRYDQEIGGAVPVESAYSSAVLRTSWVEPTVCSVWDGPTASVQDLRSPTAIKLELAEQFFKVALVKFGKSLNDSIESLVELFAGGMMFASIVLGDDPFEERAFVTQIRQHALIDSGRAFFRFAQDPKGRTFIAEEVSPDIRLSNADRARLITYATECRLSALHHMPTSNREIVRVRCYRPDACRTYAFMRVCRKRQ